MKFFITVTAFCAIMSMTIAQTAEQKQKAENFFAECSKETGISSEAVQKLRSGDFSDPSPEAKSLGKCFFKKIGFIDENGNLVESVVIDKLSSLLGDKTKAENVVKECKNNQNSEQLDITLSIYKCYLEAKANAKAL